MPAGHFLAPLLARDQRPPSRSLLRLNPSGTVVASTVEIARDSAARRRGLLGRSTLARDAAMVIAPCTAVHTFGMQFAIDVVFAARDGRVLKVVRAVAPRRFVIAWRAFATIEMAAGEAARHGISAGNYLSVE